MSERKFASTLIRDSEDKLGLTPEEVNKLLADTNTTIAKTEGFTRIGDVNFPEGLIFTSLIKLLDAGNNSDEMAGVSGIAGSLIKIILHSGQVELMPKRLEEQLSYH